MKFSGLKHLSVRVAVASIAIASISSMSIVSFMSCDSTKHLDVDVLIIGGGASGVSAAVQASRLGASVLIAEESTWLGGMLTSAGVCAFDGNFRLPAGLFGEFRDSLANHYGSLSALNTGWVSSVLFEPSVGDSIFKSMVQAESGIDVVYSVKDVVASNNAGSWIVTFNSDDRYNYQVRAKVLIDGTELGDIAKQVGVKYDIGMESKSVTNEDIAPDEANGIIQDMTMVAILKDYHRDVTISEPEDYDPDEFACTAINDRCVNPSQPDRMWPVEKMITYGKLPNDKYMINWPIEGNDYYVNVIEMNRQQRDSAIAEAKAHTMRYIYFLQTELGFSNLGLADDEFPTADRLPIIPYHRESRRIHGKVRFDLNHIMTPYDTDQQLYRTAIAVGDYPVDHHHNVYTGNEDLPNLYFHPVPSYGLPLGVIMPDSVENLLVTEKSVSVSNIVNGTTRLQPVVMQIGQAAGATAALAALNNINTSDVSVRDVQSAILDAGGYLLPYLDVDKNDPRFAAYQRIGASGILRSKGQSIAWSNETWLRANDALLSEDLNDLAGFYNVAVPQQDAGQSVSLQSVVDLIKSAGAPDFDPIAILKSYGIKKESFKDKVTRGEYALIVDKVLDPFNSKRVDITGKFIDIK